jgi:ribonuclease Z
MNSRALGVAQAMGAKACVLTHFSQRYQKLPVLEHAAEDEPNIADIVSAQDVSMTNASDPAEEDFDDMPEGPVGAEDDEAPSLPAQNADNASGQQYNLPDKVEKVPTAVNFKLKSDMKVCVAFDYMRVKVGEIAEMQHFTPALLKLFAEEERRKEEEAAIAAEKASEATRAKKGKQGKQGKQSKQDKQDKKQK